MRPVGLQHILGFAVFLSTVLNNKFAKCDSCSYPSGWRNKEWFTHYFVPVSTTGDQSDWDVWRATYSESELAWTKYGPNNNELQEDVYRCLSSKKADPYFINTLRNEASDRDRRCVYTLEGVQGKTLLMKIPYISDNPGDVSVCGSPSDYEDGRLSIRYPFDFSGVQCPWPDGRYQATFQDGASNRQCVDKSDSYAVSSGNRIDFSTCYDGATSYERPFRGTLTCVDTYTSGHFDDADGDIVVLTDSATRTPNFYCARYKEAGGVLYLSLYVGNQAIPMCEAGSRYDTTKNSYASFQLIWEDSGSVDFDFPVIPVAVGVLVALGVFILVTGAAIIYTNRKDNQIKCCGKAEP